MQRVADRWRRVILTAVLRSRTTSVIN